MSLKKHHPSIEQYCQKLHSSKPINDIQVQVLNILEHIQYSPTTFNLVTCKQTPFYQEFCNTIQGECTKEETCFALLECLIIFCREKQLRSNNKIELPLAEQNLLNFYEKSEHWDLEDGTMLHNLYWHVLPNSCDN